MRFFVQIAVLVLASISLADIITHAGQGMWLAQPGKVLMWYGIAISAFVLFWNLHSPDMSKILGRIHRAAARGDR